MRLLSACAMLTALVGAVVPTASHAQRRPSGAHRHATRAPHARARAPQTPALGDLAKTLLDGLSVARASEEMRRNELTAMSAEELPQNVALSFERAQQYGRAARTLERYLDERPDAPDRDAIEARIGYLRHLDARQRSARVRRDVARSVTPAPRPASGPSATRIAGIAMIGGSALTAVAAYVTGRMAEDSFDGLEGACAAGSCPADRMDDMDRGSHLSTASHVLTGLAIASAGAGIVLVVVGGDAAPVERPVAARVRARVVRRGPVQAQVEVVPGPTPTGIGARLRF